MREDGFYWIRPIAEDWTIGEWDSLEKQWYTIREEWSLDEDDVDEVDEHRIIRK